MTDKVEMFEIVLMQGLVIQTHTKALIKITPRPPVPFTAAEKVSQLKTASSSANIRLASFLAPNLSFLIRECVWQKVAQTEGDNGEGTGRANKVEGVGLCQGN